MLSEAAELLLASVWALRRGVCVACAASKILERNEEESLKAT